MNRPSHTVNTQKGEREYPAQACGSNTTPTPENFDPVTDREKLKPKGGLWTSPLVGEESSEWVEWCANSDFEYGKKENLYEVTPADDVKLYVIDNRQDLKDISYLGYANTYAISFEVLSKEYDGVWLSESGLNSMDSVHPDEPVMTGWDVESTIWMDFSFKEVELVTEINWDD